MKALEKDRGRRYETASAFAADVQRYLDHEAVLACPPSNWYRFRKFAQRNKRGMFAVTPIVGLLISGILGTTIGLGRALVAERLAKDRLADVERANSATTTALPETLDAKTAAEQALKQEQRASYFLKIALAEREWQNNNLDRAEQFLEECLPEHRQWEWHCLKRALHGEILTLNGHQAPATCLALSPVGRLVASGDEQGTIRIWDLSEGESVRVIQAHAERVSGLASVPMGGSLCLAAENGSRLRPVRFVCGSSHLSFRFDAWSVIESLLLLWFSL
jgi:hypothetical protein